jgi:large subunit ribosomal protein L6
MKAIHGTLRAVLSNMIVGVKEGWSKVLELVGTGYRASLSGNKLVISVGYSHPVEFEAPKGIDFKVEKTLITIEGIDKELVGLVAAKIRSIRPPEPYKGKGIKYQDEVVRRKPGKAAKTEGAAA